MDDSIKIEAEISQVSLNDGVTMDLVLHCFSSSLVDLQIGGYTGSVQGVPKESFEFIFIISLIVDGGSASKVYPNRISINDQNIPPGFDGEIKCNMWLSEADYKMLLNASERLIDVRFHEKNGRGGYVRTELEMNPDLPEIPEHRENEPGEQAETFKP